MSQTVKSIQVNRFNNLCLCCGPAVLSKGLCSSVDYYRAECRTVSWGNVLSWNLMFRNKSSLSAVPTVIPNHGKRTRNSGSTSMSQNCHSGKERVENINYTNSQVCKCYLKSRKITKIIQLLKWFIFEIISKAWFESFLLATEPSSGVTASEINVQLKVLLDTVPSPVSIKSGRN